MSRQTASWQTAALLAAADHSDNGQRRVCKAHAHMARGSRRNAIASVINDAQAYARPIAGANDKVAAGAIIHVSIVLP